MRREGRSQNLLDMAEATHTAYFVQNDKPRIGVDRNAAGEIISVFLGGAFGLVSENEARSLSPEELRKRIQDAERMYITHAGYLGRFSTPKTKFKLTLGDLVPDRLARLKFINLVLEANRVKDRLTETDLATLEKRPCPCLCRNLKKAYAL